MAAKLHKWHRRIGLLTTLFIVFLVLTGIALQHSDQLNLPTKFLSNSLLLNYYGIKPNPITTYQLGNRTISFAGKRIYLSGKLTTAYSEVVHGAVLIRDEIIIATNHSLIVIDLHGNIIDEITTQDGLVESPLGIALSQSGTVVIRGVNKYWEGSDSYTQWHVYQGAHPKWVAATITLPALKQVIESQDMSQQISLERFILDAHSGRFFGKYGVYIIDIAAILMLGLAITGIWLWSVRR